MYPPTHTHTPTPGQRHKKWLNLPSVLALSGPVRETKLVGRSPLPYVLYRIDPNLVQRLTMFHAQSCFMSKSFPYVTGFCSRKLSTPILSKSVHHLKYKSYSHTTRPLCWSRFNWVFVSPGSPPRVKEPKEGECLSSPSPSRAKRPKRVKQLTTPLCQKGLSSASPYSTKPNYKVELCGSRHRLLSSQYN